MPDFTKEKLLEQQQALGTEVGCIWNKFIEAKVRRVNYEGYAKRIEEIWAEFESNHSKLVEIGTDGTHYKKVDYFSAINSCVEEVRQFLAKAKEIEAKEIEQEMGSGSKEGADETSKNKEKDGLAENTDESVSNDGNKILDAETENRSTTGSDLEFKLPRAGKLEHKNIKNAPIERDMRMLTNRLEEAAREVHCESNSVLEVIKMELSNRYNRLSSKFDNLGYNDANLEDKYSALSSAYYDVLKMISKKASTENQPAIPSSYAKLQEVKIPYFEGGKGEWSSFYDLFQTLVHNNRNLNSVEKMYRLKTILKGDAAKLVQHLSITEYNYDVAIEMLRQRYENRRLLFSNLVDKLLDQPNLNSEVAASIRQLLDTTNECVRSIEALGLEIEHAKPFIARIILRKFDNEAMRQYEFTTKKTRQIQTLEDVIKFLEQMSQAQEEVKSKKYSSNSHQKAVVKQTNYLSTESACVYCKDKCHKIYSCKQFSQLSVNERRSWAKRTKACYICLHHTIDKRCHKENSKCLKCGRSHNILLHYESPNSNNEQPTTSTKAGTFVTKKDESTAVLLATAQVRVKSIHEEYVTLRALVDQGSQKSTISEEAAQILQLPREKSRTELYGLGDTLVGVSKSKVKLEVHPRILSKEKFELEALVLPTLSTAQPDKSFEYDVSKWDNFTLADPSFNKSDRIDIVLGADIYHHILDEKQKIRKVDKLVGQPTKLGWMISGILQIPLKQLRICSAVTTSLERFWEQQEVPDEDKIPDEEETSKYFEKTTTINNENRFVVRLPFVEDKELGNSRKQAVARFLNLEKRLQKDVALKQQYTEFMREYLKMKHMTSAPLYSGKYYLPHQPVIREGSLTTKLRVVFDASAKTSNHRSLNDVLKVGPKLQKDVFDIIIKWRFWRYVLTADVEKMFRQILINEEDQLYQHVIWREKPNQPIKEFRLATVTYGTASAPFLAKKALAQIGTDCVNNELLKKIILEDFYMDDLMTGADSMQELKDLREKISIQLAKFGFPLRKWMSNSCEILQTIPDKGNVEVVPIEEDETVKTLGLQWHPTNDVFMFKLEVNFEGNVTKRRALSILARIFDPLGWLTPLTTCIKLFIQKLWLMHTDWDVHLDSNLQKEWEVIIKSLKFLKHMQISRWFHTATSTLVELHGFADASQKAYAAVVYIKIGPTINLVAAKSKVNPVKNRKTLPKLELCAAHLLAKLVNRIVITIQNNVIINAWSDSTITLSWIKNNKNKDRFIRTRADEINKLVPNAIWRHVDTKSNPADAASRGVTAEKMSSLWWNGPSWLNSGESDWPKQEQHYVTSMAVRVRNSEKWIEEVSKRCSTYRKLERVIAYVIRFIGKLRGQKFQNWLTSNELEDANKVIIQQHQEQNFFNEIHCLKQQKMVDIKSKTASLHPFLDDDGILRVGGRLYNSELLYNQKYPILLERSWLAELLIKQAHNNTLHGGKNLVSSIVRRKYWIIGMLNLVKKILRYCVKCTRYRKINATQIMGNLPQSRVAISHPFTNTGVDYAGPIQMKCSRGRGQKSFKGYIAVFVCMATRAIHLEAVSDLTTDAFLAALRRFFARRGKAKCIYSDNGTNFIGASNKLDKEFKEAIKQNSSVQGILESEKINWHFIPPASPHFGGIWEGGVKSVKHHLRRVLGDSMLTYEEMATLLSQIEAVLNSRPLCVVSGGPEDIDVLTPGHFLIGQPLLEIPEKIEEKSITSMDRWKIVQKMKKDFWNRWMKEYLLTLQHRYKWRQETLNLKENQVVIIKDESTSPSKWPLGKVIETHAGKDGKVRVVTLKVQKGTLKRPIHKLCPLEEMKQDQNEDTRETAHINFTKIVTRRNSKNALAYILMILLCATLAKALPTLETAASIRGLGNNTIMYLDKIGSLNRVSSSWNLVVYYNMEPYFSTVNHIESILNVTANICQKVRAFEEQCNSVILGMETRLMDIRENNKIFSHQEKTRVKRAPFEFVGSFYHVLFGLMDAEDRKSIEENMRNLLENQHNLKDMMKKQTSVVESTLNILKKTTDDVNLQFKNIRDKVNNISDEVNTDYHFYEENIKFFMATKQLEIMVDEAEKVQIQVIGLLMDINHGKINPNLIRPSKMQEEVIKIKNNLSDKLRLPGKSKEAILSTIYRLMTARGVFVDDKLVIDIKIPLLETQSSDIFNMIPLPVMKSHTKMLPILRQQFLVYNYEIDSYHLITQSVLNQCEMDGEEEYLCKGNWAWDDANDNSCELSSLKPSNVFKCSFTEVNSKDIWVELHTKGSWLFRTYVNRSAHIVCSKETRAIEVLPQQGIITLDPGCTARIGRTTLTSPQDMHSQQAVAFKTYLFKEAKDAEIIKPIQTSVIGQAERVDELLKELKMLKTENIKLKGLNWHHVSGHSSLIIISIFIIIIIVFLIKRKCTKNRRPIDIKFHLPGQNVQN